MTTTVATSNHPITGAPKPAVTAIDGSVPLRLEIRNLQKNTDQWNLYLLGLDALKKLDQISDLSFYGIAGIHGRPYKIWGGVANANPKGSWQGYCTHTSILFAPWHRPFLALYEQTLYSIVQNIAAQFPSTSRARYTAAAATFRIPYWDWATQHADDPEGYFPAIVSTQYVNVITPTSGGQVTQIANPLYSTTFNPLIPGDFSTGTTQSGWPTTLRYPSDPSSPSATSQDSQVTASMKTNYPNLRDTVNTLLTDPKYTNYTTFSNHQLISNDAGDEGSLENVHDSIHGTVGGNGGHMSDLDYAAHDPAFWLHHANVDRIFAIWQALNLSSYTFDEADPSFEGTFVMLADTEDNLDTELSPFTDGSGKTYWTPNTVVSTETFNYSYPEIQKWLFQNDTQYQQNIRNCIQNLYGATADSIANGTSTTTTSAATGTESQQPVVGSSCTYTDYITTIKTYKHGLGESYRVHIFLGDFNPDVTTWHTLDALAGIFMVFGRNTTPGAASETGCGKCKQDAKAGVQISGIVSLTAQLLFEVKKGNCPSMNKADVIPYLTKNLHWRVTLHDGSEHPREDVPGLVVSVNTTEVSVHVNGLPQRSGVYEAHPEVTAGRAAGSSAPNA
ncbi:Di-copper centre-containing protein [Mollisia scopiformis]|uniref:tyrosinase n=1 Tax=Mollisia scopiformis TaxID=149040 RepID=A0A194XN78_MOLSC|nr:Di-copper centre-containing protein [Mollisia scopiformis]KUJ21549.1 Di-copper centre-containing protein [Mollisia scopiformis]